MSENTTNADRKTDDETPPITPFLQIVNADATPEEIAALVAVLSSLGGGERPTSPRRPEWNAPHRLVQQNLPHGPGGWQASGLPR